VTRVGVATLTVAVASNVRAGSYTLLISAVTDGAAHSTLLTLQVRDGPARRFAMIG
jgi:hypothetical protein